jgi:hypothetical protein
MDPWLEQHWGDVHTRLVTYASDRLQSHLPGDLRARGEERVYLEDEETRRKRHFIPDVQVVEYPTSRRRSDDGGVAVLEASEPIVVSFPEETDVDRFIEIRDYQADRRLVTVIEVLSGINKGLPARREVYRKKREELLMAGVNLVEIDLLRQGKPMELHSREKFARSAGCPYFISVYRVIDSHWQDEMYPCSMRERLPVIRIPLRMKDKDVLLDIQQLVNDAYDRGGYDILDYSTPPWPPLSEEDEAWVKSWLAERAKPANGSP